VLPGTDIAQSFGKINELPTSLRSLTHVFLVLLLQRFMSGASPGQENNPQTSKPRVSPGDAHVQGGVVPPKAIRDSEFGAALLTPHALEPWRQQLVDLRTSLFFAHVSGLLEQAGNLILFPTEHQAFLEGQRDCVDRYIAFRASFGAIFKQLMQASSWSAMNLPVVLGGLNKAAVKSDKFACAFERSVIDQLKALKTLSEDAVVFHKAAFDEAVKTDSRGRVGVDRIPDEADILDASCSDGDEQRDIFAGFDSELQDIVNQCNVLSHYVDNRDEATCACSAVDFVLDKGRGFHLESRLDSTTLIVGKLGGLAVVLEQSLHLLKLSRNKALDAVRLERAADTPLTQKELLDLQDALVSPCALAVDEEFYTDGGERRRKVVMEATLALGDSMRTEYAKAYGELESYFNALKSYGAEQGVGVVVYTTRPKIQLFVDAVNRSNYNSLTKMGPYPGQDGSNAWADEGAGEKHHRADPRVSEDMLLSGCPEYKRGIFIECSHAALASKEALANFQAARELIHRWADLEGGFETATLKAFAPKGTGEGAGLQKKWEENQFKLSLTSTPELGPNFRLEQTKHPLSRALPCDEELAAEKRGLVPHVWGPTLASYRSRRCLEVETGACRHSQVVEPVGEILRHAHPLFFSVAVRRAGEGDEKQMYDELAQELMQLTSHLGQIKNELGGKKLYLAQLDIVSEKSYPGFKNIAALYNIYDFHGVLVSRVHVERGGSLPSDITLVSRKVNGRDLEMAETELRRVLAGCGADLRHTHTDVRKHFADRHIYLCDTVVQAICWASEPSSTETPEEAIAKIFRGPSVWIERELDPEGGTRLYVFSQREGEYR
jgi:hypothetical protein